MFVTKREATERLADKGNLFRDPSLVTPVPGEENEADTAPSPASGSAQESDEDDPEQPAALSSSDSLFDTKQLDDLIRPRTVAHPYRGRPNAQVGISEISLIAGSRTAGAIAGIAPRNAHAYSGGLSAGSEALSHPPTETTYRANRRRLLENMKDRLALKAGKRLAATLRLLSDEKLENVTKASELSAIAKDMAAVMDKVSPKEAVDAGGVHFHIWKPDVLESSEYETVEVGAAPTIDVTPTYATSQ